MSNVMRAVFTPQSTGRSPGEIAIIAEPEVQRVVLAKLRVCLFGITPGGARGNHWHWNSRTQMLSVGAAFG